MHFLPIYALGNTPASASFDPATLSLTGWWRGSYGPIGTWSPTASAGTSGSNGNLTEIGSARPAVGTAQNDFNPADCDGSNDRLTNTNTTATFFSSTAWSMCCLFLADVADAVGSDEYDNPSLMASQGASAAAIGMAFSDSGVSAWHAAGGDWPGLYAACGTGVYHLAQAKYDGSNIKLRIDGGAWSSVAAASADQLGAGETLVVGTDWFNVKFFNGRILEVMLSNTAFSDSTFTNILSYINSRYSLSLT